MNNPPRPHNARRVLDILAHLWRHRDRTVGLGEVADRVHLSPAHCHRLYRAVTGETLRQTHERMRMSEARSHLFRSDWSVERVARRLGFGSAAAFVRAFARHTGTTPGQWRLDASAPLTDDDKERLMHTVQLIDLPPMDGISLPHRGDYLLIGERFEFFHRWAAQHAPALAEGVAWGIYHDDPSATPIDALRSAVFCHGTPPAGVELAEGMVPHRIPAQRCAVVEHQGPYDTLHKSYAWLYGEWLAGGAEQPADAPCLEHYLNSPVDTPPEQLRTRIHLPLAPQ